jgi:hypothetical protein
VALVLLVLASVLLLPGLAPRGSESGQSAVGFTYSQRQAEYLGLQWQDAFAASLALSPSVIRLGAYWDEIEREPGQYDFAVLDWLLARVPPGRTVVLTVGMKAPRWPEYYLPAWLERDLDAGDGDLISDHARLRGRTLGFVAEVVRRYRGTEAIGYWQVENEPLDPAGPHGWRIGADFLHEEVALVRSLDSRPVVVSTFVPADPLSQLPGPWGRLRERSRAILAEADVLGLDIYPARGVRSHGLDLIFTWPRWAWEPVVADLQRLARAKGKEAWIMEAQAEPWEPGRLVYTDRPRSRSAQPETAARTFAQLRAAGFPTVLLWGVEYWQMRQQRHDDRGWLETMQPLFAR